MPHIRKSDLSLLLVFSAVFQEGSLTRAARTLNLTQPAISHSLAKLRELFGDPLFVRQGNTMAPTPLARQMIVPVAEALERLQGALALPRQFDPQHAELQFRLGLRDIMEAITLPPLLQDLSVHAPHVSISSVRSERRQMASELSGGQLDLAVDVFLPLGKDICHCLLVKEQLVVLGRPNHPLLATPLSLDAYLRARHISVSSRRHGLAAEDFELSRRGLQREIALRCQHYFAAFEVARHTDLLLTMPRRYARLINRHLQTPVLPVPLEIPPLDIYLYWHARVHDEPANAWLRQRLLSIFDPAYSVNYTD